MHIKCSKRKSLMNQTISAFNKNRDIVDSSDAELSFIASKTLHGKASFIFTS